MTYAKVDLNMSILGFIVDIILSTSVSIHLEQRTKLHLFEIYIAILINKFILKIFLYKIKNKYINKEETISEKNEG